MMFKTTNQIEIEQELSQLGDLPSRIEGTCAQIPHGYFDELAQNITEQVEEDSFLQKLPREAPFLLDASYLETFALAEPRRKEYSLSWLQPAGIAAAFALLVGGYLALAPMQPAPEFSATIAVEQISEVEAAVYIAENIEDFAEDVVVETPPQRMRSTSTPRTTPEIDNLKPEDINSYLSESPDDELL
jgi:hypothetical protein